MCSRGVVWVQELKAKRLEMAKLQIQLQQAENRKNQALFAGVVAADERARKQREAEEFEAMKLRVMQLEKLVAAAAPASAPASAPKVGLLWLPSCAGTLAVTSQIMTPF